MTPEEAFALGAEAMRTEIAVRLITNHQPIGAVLGPVVLAMPLPRFQTPESQIIEEQ